MEINTFTFKTVDGKYWIKIKNKKIVGVDPDGLSSLHRLWQTDGDGSSPLTIIQGKNRSIFTYRIVRCIPRLSNDTTGFIRRSFFLKIKKIKKKHLKIIKIINKQS